MNETRINSKMQLKRTVDTLSFAVVELGLYLNTHPEDAEALKAFHEFNTRKKSAMKEYSSLYEPLSLDYVKTDKGYFNWISTPWPWEGGNM